MNNKIILNEIQLDEIRILAKELRQARGFGDDIPIANDIFSIIEDMKILLLEYPIKTDGDKQAFSAVLLYSEEEDTILTFIGLNTADFFDKQIFAIAHELYHYTTRTASHLSRLSEEESSLDEVLANRFTAEFLLPKITLESIILKEFRSSTLQNIQLKVLLRFIARIQCSWWLPFRSITKRLKEICAISEEQYTQLYLIDERNLEGEYGRIGLATNRDIFIKLNNPTNSIGTSPSNQEIIIRNFEDNIIDEDQFYEIMDLFGKKPKDFGYESNVSEEDISDINSTFDKE